MIVLKRLWQQIATGLRFIGKIQTAIILSVFYFLILGPIALPYQLITSLTHKTGSGKSYWKLRQVDDEGGLWRQF